MECHTILTGDFNAHFNGTGRVLLELQDMRNFILNNDDSPTYLPKNGGEGNVLDMFLSSDSITSIAFVDTLPDVGTSDHLPVSMLLPLSLNRVCQSSE